MSHCTSDFPVCHNLLPRSSITRNVQRATLILRLGVARYFEGGVSSVFLWDLDDGGFAGVVLLKKGAAYTS